MIRDPGADRGTQKQCCQDQEQVILQRIPRDNVRQGISLCIDADSGQIGKEMPQLSEIFKIEDPESYEDHQFAVDMFYPDRPFFEPLFAEFLLKENKQAVIQSPEDKVPGGAVPQPGTEPYQKQTKVLPALSENGNIQKIIPEEGAQGDVPSLPEFGDRLAHIGMGKVLIKMESEDPAHSNGHIRITAEIKIHIQGINQNRVPGAGGRQMRNIRAEEGLKRIAGRSYLDRLDRESIEFHQAVFRGYQEIVRKYADRIIVIDAGQDVESVIEQACQVIREILDA